MNGTLEATQFDIGVAEIDQQARDILVTLDEVQNASESGEASEAMASRLESLKNMFLRRFRYEEVLLRTYNHPEIEQHQAQHRKFENQFTLRLGKAQTVHDSAAQRMIHDELIAFVSLWIKFHIVKEDQALGRFLESEGAIPRQRGAASPRSAPANTTWTHAAHPA